MYYLGQECLVIYMQSALMDTLHRHSRAHCFAQSVNIKSFDPQFFFKAFSQALGPRFRSQYSYLEFCSPVGETVRIYVVPNFRYAKGK